jgi:hypothetical protein
MTDFFFFIILDASDPLRVGTGLHKRMVWSFGNLWMRPFLPEVDRQRILKVNWLLEEGEVCSSSVVDRPLDLPRYSWGDGSS